METKCYKCNHTLDLQPNKDLARSEDCPGCFTDLRCCKMCMFFDTSSYNDCKEPTAERILEKEKANFCDHFKLGLSSDSSNEKDDILAKANSLFK